MPDDRRLQQPGVPRDPVRNLNQRKANRGGPGSPACDARGSGLYHPGSWSGVRKPSARRAGIPERRCAERNAYIESFNGRSRDERLDEHWFLTMAHARSIIEMWRIE